MVQILNKSNTFHSSKSNGNVERAFCLIKGTGCFSVKLLLENILFFDSVKNCFGER